MGFPPVPPEVKPVAHLLKLADDHEARNIVVAYWARMAACRLALKLTPNSQKSPEVSALITAILDWLEQTKKDNMDNDGIIHEAAAAAIIEEYALQLFEHGDKLDRSLVFDKNTVKTFYTSGMLMDVLEQFEMSDEIMEKRKYAKWKAAYIHNCLKKGEKPIPGGPEEQEAAMGQDNIMHVSDLTDEERATFDEELRKKSGLNRNSMDNQDAFGQNGNLSKPEDNNAFAPAPASSPITPIVPTTPQAVPFTPQPATTPLLPAPSSDTNISLNPDQIHKAQKYCKYATSALNYDDVKTAIDNLNKALNLLQLGKEQ